MNGPAIGLGLCHFDVHLVACSDSVFVCRFQFLSLLGLRAGASALVLAVVSLVFVERLVPVSHVVARRA